MIAALKFVHLAGISCWAAGLIALALLMLVFGTTNDEDDYVEYRLFTHVTYISFVTPAALIAIASGTALCFAAGIFEPWLLLKLAFVAGMVLVHTWLGHLIQRSGEERRSKWFTAPFAGLALVPLICAVIGLALVKPQAATLSDLLPAQLLSVREGAAP